MATFVMQALGMDVAAMNTVHFSKLLHLFCFVRVGVGLGSNLGLTLLLIRILGRDLL